MGLLEKACATYDSQSHLVGVSVEGKEMLSPISHITVNADIEICINKDGKYSKATRVVKDDRKTTIPVTMESAGRTSSAGKLPHPLADQIKFLADYPGSSYAYYFAGLDKWAESEFSHPSVRAVRDYIKGKTILSDLAGEGLIKLKDGAPENEKEQIRWRVIGASDTPETWRDRTLFDSYVSYYESAISELPKALCYVSCVEEVIAAQSPKGVLSYANGAKLISANDASGFTYRGRFSTPDEAAVIGYETTQKAHAALRWLASNYGVTMGNRTFVWWRLPHKRTENSSVKVGMSQDFIFGTQRRDEKQEIADYHSELYEALAGLKNSLEPNDDVITVSLEAATTGRLSVTYYSQLKAEDFIERINLWYKDITYSDKGYAPPIKQIIQCALGDERDNFIDCDAKLLSEMSGVMLKCVIDNAPIPESIVFPLVNRFGNIQRYSKQGNRARVRNTAFSVVRKYRNRKYKEEWNLGLDRTETDRSYLFGRLLALYEKLERATYSEEDRTKRETNSERYREVFVQRPGYGLATFEKKIQPYKKKLRISNFGLLNYFDREIGEVMGKLGKENLANNERLDEKYILGYYHQLYAKSDKNGTDNETIDETEEKEIEQ